MRENLKELFKSGLKPYGDYPTSEPREVVVGSDGGKVVITVGEGTLVFEPDDALALGKGIVEEATRCKNRVSPLRKR